LQLLTVGAVALHGYVPEATLLMVTLLVVEEYVCSLKATSHEVPAGRPVSEKVTWYWTS
jgi:hypothetical protein